MSTFRLQIKCDNEAFSDDPGAELARLLREVANEIEEGYQGGGLNDVNGNRVGSYTLTGGKS
jgi:hypothetical protein